MSSWLSTTSARLLAQQTMQCASATRESQLCQASSARRTFCDAVSRVNGGGGGGAASVTISAMCTSFSAGLEHRQDDSAPRHTV